VFCVRAFNVIHQIFVLPCLSLDFIDQGARFSVQEGVGCRDAVTGYGIDFLLYLSWPIVFPLVSTLFYCRESLHSYTHRSALTVEAKIIYVFYKHSRETNQFLQSNGAVNRQNYLRILALACVDIVLTLPVGVLGAVSAVIEETLSPLGSVYEFYYGWSNVHTNWGPVNSSYPDVRVVGFWAIFQLYLALWTSPILAIVIFSLFGLTTEARAMYWRGICAVGKLFGWKTPARNRDDIGEIQFGVRQLTVAEQYAPLFLVEL
jgi:hypothetical protein